MNEFPAIDQLLPHGRQAVALDAVTAWEAGRFARARLTVRPALVLYDNDAAGIPAWGGIEIMAQTLGIYAALESGCTGTRPPPGYLVGVRHFCATRAALEDGLELESEAECLHCERYGLANFDCRIRHADLTLVSARLSVWRPRPAGEAA
jgi:predicted hotdog family 3-hydroxylacyl-ACP dehydratase